jgi:hypothetical protein
MEYIHDEWCASKLGTWPGGYSGKGECDCVVSTLKEKDEEIQYLKDMGEIMMAVIKQLKEGYDVRL